MDGYLSTIRQINYIRNRREQARTGENRREQARTGENRREQARTGENRREQARTGETPVLRGLGEIILCKYFCLLT
ncbi:MAG: hypothetical protein SXA11_18290 [Cyanobacteriota bacterium]|nr:hypothetical protein [Cyanobacteriota bacterium]